MGTIDRQLGSGRPRSVCVNENTENVEDLVFSQEDNPKSYRLNREISCETGIHWLTVHRIIYCDLQLHCVKRCRAQQLSETNLSDSLQAAAVRGTVWLHMVWGWKCLPLNHHSTRRTIGFMHQLKRYINPSWLLRCYACRLWVMVIAVSQVGMTEVIFVNHRV